MPRPDRTADAIELLKQIAREFNIDTKSLRDREYLAHVTVPAKRAFCTRGTELGIKPRELAIALNKDRSTVVYHASEKVRSLKNASRKPWLPRSERRHLKILKETGEANAEQR